MYTRFYNLKEKPFGLAPDSEFLYLSRRHREALGHLLYGIREQMGFILVSGEVGTGKTTLCRALIKEIEREAEVGFILNSFLSEDELIRAINEDLVGKTTAETTRGLIDELNGFLLKAHGAGKNVVLILDESQNLSCPVLEQIRMLSNLETEKHKLLQIVLVGQPELRDKLEADGMRQLAQRIGVSYHLEPLDLGETAKYIEHRLNVAGGNMAIEGPDVKGKAGPAFSRAAVKRVYRHSEGVPRKINIVCDRALLIGYVKGKRKINDRIVRRAIGEIDHGQRRAARKRSGQKRRSYAPRLAAFGLVLAVALVFLGRASLHRRSDPGEAIEVKSPPSRSLPQEAYVTRALAGLWGSGMAVEDIPEEEKDIPALAGLVGFEAVSVWATDDFLKGVDIPFIAWLAARGAGDSLVAVVYGITDRYALIDSVKGRRSIGKREFVNRINGPVTYLLPEGSFNPAVVAPGTEGVIVSELQGGLRGVGYLTVYESGVYGPHTASAVKRLQERFGLPVDGIAGPNEKLLLYSLLAGEQAPRLLKEERTGEIESAGKEP